MRLSTKFLTTLSSIAVVGTIVPATVSCSCSKDQYLFNYGDQVNCRDEKDSNYQKPEDVKKAAQIRAIKAQKGTISELIKWTDENGKQLIFYDLIASAVITNNENINLKEWNDTAGVSFIWNGEQHTGTSFEYVVESDKTISLKCGDFKYRSYTYYDCLGQ